MEQYIVLSKIGEGAFGKALLARERSGSRRRCVLKQVSLSRMSARDRESAKKEVTILSKMKHPNIVMFFQSFYERNSLYIVMEYCDGGDLMQKIILQRGKPFTEEQITDWLVQMCLGLKHIHDRKILHRDIKAQNIFLSQGDKRVKLGDFGIARMLNNTTELARTWVGTPNYISPEICENKPYNNKTDVWSLGCVLYELCTLKHPFEANSWRQLIVKICRGRYNPISNHYTPELSLLLSQLFKVSPQDRPSVNSLLKRPLLHRHTSKNLEPQVTEKDFSHTVLPKDQPVAQHVDKHISVVPRPDPAVKALRRLPPRPECRCGVEKPRVTSNKKNRGQAAGLQVERRAAQCQETKNHWQNHDHRNQLQHRLHQIPVQPRSFYPPPLHHPPCLAEPEPTELEKLDNRPNDLEPFQLVAAAREEYLQRRQEANQYKHRAEKQLGLRPSTGEAERYRGLNKRVASPQPAAPDRVQGEQEYLRQLQKIRQRYRYEIREGRQRADAKVQDHAAGAYVKTPTENHTHPQNEEQKPTDMKHALNQILQPIQKERKELQRKRDLKKAVMFEIKLHHDEEEEAEDVEEQNEPTDMTHALNQILQPIQKERKELQRKRDLKKAVMFEIKLHHDEEEEAQEDMEEQNEVDIKHQEDPAGKSASIHRPADEADVELEEREETNEGGEKRVKRGLWRHEAPRTLLNALANMKVSSIWSTYSSTQDGATDEEEENPGPQERRKWSIRPPVTLLNVLAEAQLTCSTQGSVETPDEDETPEEVTEKTLDEQKTEYKEEEYSDVEVDEERLEPRSDDDDTNFEESDDEMMEQANDSMTNFFIMKDGDDKEEARSVKEADEGRNTETHTHINGTKPALG